MTGGTYDSGGVRRELVGADRQRVGQSVTDHGSGVADQNHVEYWIKQTCERRSISRQRGDFFLTFTGHQLRHADPLYLGMNTHFYLSINNRIAHSRDRQ